jgi:hypothetical protein
MTVRTGGWNTRWVELEKPKPPRVEDRYRYWTDPPETASDRCRYWLRQIDRGWRPNRQISGHGYDGSAEWYGIYIWEYLYLVAPRLAALRDSVVPTV